MKLQKKKIFAILLTVAMTMSLTVGCSGGTSDASDQKGSKPTTAVQSSKSDEAVTLTVWTQRAGDEASIFEEVIKDFEKANPNIKVDFNAPGKDYENMLRIKMSSNEMPDVWSTHGWAVGRYSELLADLSSESWVSRMIPSIKDQVTDKNGHVISMCIDSDTAGIGYNVDVFQKYGVTPPKTIDELYAVCEKIKTASNGKVTPIHIGGGDGFPIAQAVDYLSSTLCTTDSKHNYQDSLKDGTFDWKNYRPLADFFKTLKAKGYLNTDVLTAKNDDTVKAMASGDAAMSLNGFSTSVTKYNPDAKIGFFAIPTFYKDDTPVIVGGETDAWGVWKDTKHMEAAKKFVAYFADPAVNKKICEATKIRSAFTDVTANLGDMSPYYANTKDLRIVPYFDRTSFPSGMWDSMQKFGQMLLTDDYSVDQYLSDMSADYSRLKKQ